MSSLILHDSTRALVEHFIANPSHAVLLSGADGMGKTAIAEFILSQLLGLDTAAGLANYPHFMKITPDGTSISIDEIRALQQFLRLKTIGQRPLRRAVLVEHAQALTTEAQNSYLKLLEEPPADTVMALTVDSPRSLLPTILSRAQAIAITAPTEAQLQPLLDASGKDAASVRQAYFMSGGLPGLLTALLSGDETHPLLASVATAKEILQKTPFERLSMVDALSKQKDQAAAVVAALERIAETMIAQAAARNNTAHIKQWHRIRRAAHQTGQALQQSANAKLAVSDLFLHL